MPNIIQNNKINLQNGVDIGEFDRLIANALLKDSKRCAKMGRLL
ncbi:MAG TPA: hypothetical protein PLP24_00505 [Acetivibrio thermocellus]|nr:hypothetical protein [Acetivibrio thermocellus]HOP91835.1 hypothetical protein [Acetivibrio thermocellus]